MTMTAGAVLAPDDAAWVRAHRGGVRSGATGRQVLALLAVLTLVLVVVAALWAQTRYGRLATAYDGGRAAATADSSCARLARAAYGPDPGADSRAFRLGCTDARTGRSHNPFQLAGSSDD